MGGRSCLTVKCWFCFWFKSQLQTKTIIKLKYWCHHFVLLFIFQPWCAPFPALGRQETLHFSTITPTLSLITSLIHYDNIQLWQSPNNLQFCIQQADAANSLSLEKEYEVAEHNKELRVLCAYSTRTQFLVRTAEVWHQPKPTEVDIQRKNTSFTCSNYIRDSFRIHEE